MAKKKANNKSNATSVETMPRSSSDDAASPPESSTTQQEQKPVEAMSVEELRMELLAARAELTKSKDQTAGKLAQPQEVQELHVKLQQLRKEQQEADAARDKAWSQLKVRSAAQGRQTDRCACKYKFGTPALIIPQVLQLLDICPWPPCCTLNTAAAHVCSSPCCTGAAHQ